MGKTLEEMIEEVEKVAVYHDKEKLPEGEWHYTNEVTKEKYYQLTRFLKELKNYRDAEKRVTLQNMEAVELIKQELLMRGDETVTFRQLVERFEDVDKEFCHTPWNLMQIFSNFQAITGKKPEKSE